jgi:hypothetical protein
VLGSLGAEPPAAQIPTHGGARQPPTITLGDQLADRIAGPEKPRQAQLIGGALADQRNEFLLLRFGEGRLLARTAPATLLSEPCPAALPVASDPAVHRIGMHPEQPRGLGLSHAIQHRSDGPIPQRRLRRSRQ